MTVRLVDRILSDARWRGAQEVEIRRLPTCGAVRYRQKNGTLHLRMRLSLTELDGVIEQLKVMASLTPGQRGPQIGELHFRGAGIPPLRLRLRTLPTPDGEDLWILFPGAPDASGEAEEAFLDLLRGADREEEDAAMAWCERLGLPKACL